MHKSGASETRWDEVNRRTARTKLLLRKLTDAKQNGGLRNPRARLALNAVLSTVRILREEMRKFHDWPNYLPFLFSGYGSWIDERRSQMIRPSRSFFKKPHHPTPSRQWERRATISWNRQIHTIAASPQAAWPFSNRLHSFHLDLPPNSSASNVFPIPNFRQPPLTCPLRNRTTKTSFPYSSRIRAIESGNWATVAVS